MRGWVLLVSAFIIHADAVTDCHDSLLGMGILEDLPVRSSHGTNEESFRTMSCCQSDGTCHGGFDLPQRALKELIDPKRTSIHPRTKRSLEIGEVDTLKNEIPCCPTNISVYFPIIAVSANTYENVHVIQSDPILLQPVLYGRCLTSRSPILQADCRQMYVAESMMTVKFDANNFKIERQPVIVPNGCECQLTPPAIKDTPKLGEVLNSILGEWN